MRQGLMFLLLLAACAPAPDPVPPSVATAAPAPDPAVAAGLVAPDAPDIPVAAQVTARITGRVTYPSEALPAMRVCAVDSTNPGRASCFRTALHQATYMLDVPPGDWWLMAWPQDTGTAGDPGLLSVASACLASGATGCDDHSPLVIRVAAGDVRDGLDINDWYYDPRVFPPPMQPRDDPAR